ncbi:DUF4142 domain-containing protein [Hufsiella ginkgonis]|uniref:DUF4142 domain-containing protein n=1 Tax=Hufsiella ginkgonis TaxID=2695274 RepID=A0A7K1Y094_9SPHI|nr:DUF4142 domain-containing protein [Hufsiella ginkgonis]MXV16650.1 DUF4142 domain-containing protein [Hufsiella ginkgonis]
MKTTKRLLVTGLAMALFAACSGNKDGKETADSLNDAKDTSGITANDSTQNGAAAMTVNSDDADFAVNAANGGMAEVELGKLASGKTANPKVKEFAKMMASDHTKANEELMALAKSKNISLPAAVAEEQMKVKEDLSAKSGAAFDKAYVDVQVKDHKKTVDLFEKASKDASDPDLKAFATKTLPTLRTHLSTIEKIQAGMK